MICLSREREKPVIFPFRLIVPFSDTFLRPTFRLHAPYISVRFGTYRGREDTGTGGEKRKRKRGHVSRFPRRRYGFLLHGKASGEVRGKFHFSSTASTDPVGLSNVRLPEGRIQKACQQRLLPSLHAKPKHFLSLEPGSFSTLLRSTPTSVVLKQRKATSSAIGFLDTTGKPETTREEEVFHPLERRVVLRPFRVVRPTFVASCTFHHAAIGILP